MSYHTGATFYPGGEDSYYLPEVVSPMPQRIAELPENIQENVAHMEQEASWKTSPPNPSYMQNFSHPPHTSSNSWNQAPSGRQQWSPELPPRNGSLSGPAPYQQPQYQAQRAPVEQPNFSPFPPIRNRGPNVPPSDEERETTLEEAREAVLSSTDFEMQLAWAQDALTLVEIAIQNETNVAVIQGPRPRTPRVEHMLREDAMKIVEFLASQHHPKAEFMKGLWLEFGKFGHRCDKREAFNCYSRASERGYARAYYRMGMQFENSNDSLKAIKYYQMGVDANDAASCYRLGMMTLLGQQGQMRDFGRGLQLMTTSAQRADDNAPQGAYVLGMLQAGELAQVQIPEHVLPRDLGQAKANIEKAAFLGFAKAQSRMGQAYELSDLNCHFDPALSLHYNALAARQGETEAEMAISKWFLCGQEGVFEKNEEMAFTYAQRAAVSGLATAQFALGYFYEVGIYVSMDLKQAREWYQKADENGNADARKRIEAVSRSKTISRRDHENVSLQRIRQQHAAAAAAPTLPPLSEVPPLSNKPQSPTIDMPDPARLSLNPNQGPQRPASTAPYPLGNDHLTVNSNNPNYRPTSAFGINPRLQQQQQYQQQQSNQYSQSASTGRPEAHRFGSAPNVRPDRPYSSVETGQSDPNYGRDNRMGTPQPPGSYPQQPRPPQGPNQRPPPGPSQQRPSTTSPYIGPQSGQSPRPSQTPLNRPVGADIGFSAPPETKTSAQRRPLPSQQQQSQQPPQQRLPQASPKQDYSSPQSGGQRPQPPYQQPQQPKPPQKPYDNANIKPANLAPSKPIAAPPTPRPDQQKPQKVAAASAASRPPGKGPKTFDEMGVPQAQKESDCVIM